MSKSESLQRAAMVLKSLPKREAAMIMSKLEASEIRDVVRETESLGEQNREAVLAALNQLCLEAEPLKTDRQAERERLNGQLIDQSGGSTEQDSGPFHFLAHLSPVLRSELMADEHPENVALVMMFLPSEVGSTLLRGLDSPMQVSIVRRLCEFRDTDQRQIHELALHLKLRLQKKLQRSEKPEGVQLAGQLLSCSEDRTRDQVLSYINQLDPLLVNELEQSIFRFEDLTHLEDLDVRILLKNVDTTYWAPALKIASLGVRGKILSNMAPRVVQLLNEQIEGAESLGRDTSNLAQLEIVNVCIQLNECGKIELPNRKSQMAKKIPA